MWYVANSPLRVFLLSLIVERVGECEQSYVKSVSLSFLPDWALLHLLGRSGCIM